uniref:Uncharacterized protein n=1 Tax=Oryza glumipatula TaxID=40148 RepID=A0A0D9YZZ4_9ORYZ
MTTARTRAIPAGPQMRELGPTTRVLFSKGGPAISVLWGKQFTPAGNINSRDKSKSFACVLHPAANQSLVIHARGVSWPWPGPSPLDFWEPSDLSDWTEKKLEDGEGVYLGAEVAVKIPLSVDVEIHREQPVHVQGRSLVADRRPACRIPGRCLNPGPRRPAYRRWGTRPRARVPSPTYTDRPSPVCVHAWPRPRPRCTYVSIYSIVSKYFTPLTFVNMFVRLSYLKTFIKYVKLYAYIKVYLTMNQIINNYLNFLNKTNG